MKNPPQTQLQIQPMKQRAVVSNCNSPIPKLRQQLPKRSPPLMSSFREQQKLLNPAQIVPEKQKWAAASENVLSGTRAQRRLSSAVWSESSFPALWNFASLAIQKAASTDSVAPDNRNLRWVHISEGRFWRSGIRVNDEALMVETSLVTGPESFTVQLFSVLSVYCS